MSEYKYDTDYLEVGDEFNGGPIEQSYFISAVMAAGGEVEIHGDKVFILQLPKKEVPKAKAPVSATSGYVQVVEKSPAPKEVDLEIAIAPAPKEEIPKEEVIKPPAKVVSKPKVVPAPEVSKKVVS